MPAASEALAAGEIEVVEAHEGGEEAQGTVLQPFAVAQVEAAEPRQRREARQSHPALVHNIAAALQVELLQQRQACATPPLRFSISRSANGFLQHMGRPWTEHGARLSMWTEHGARLREGGGGRGTAFRSPTIHRFPISETDALSKPIQCTSGPCGDHVGRQQAQRRHPPTPSDRSERRSGRGGRSVSKPKKQPLHRLMIAPPLSSPYL